MQIRSFLPLILSMHGLEPVDITHNCGTAKAAPSSNRLLAEFIETGKQKN